jgi:hypothetical protein
MGITTKATELTRAYGGVRKKPLTPWLGVPFTEAHQRGEHT